MYLLGSSCEVGCVWLLYLFSGFESWSYFTAASVVGFFVYILAVLYISTINVGIIQISNINYTTSHLLHRGNPAIILHYIATHITTI